ncbi:MAG TPA: DNA helicase RecQ [Pantanalinema sp.]
MRVETEIDSSLLDLLRRHWGYDSFLPNQAEAVRSVMERRDCLVILPTGGGKSMCYQLPALALDGMAVVVSPLLALMKDQVDALLSNGIAAATLNSSLSADEKRRTYQAIREGAIKLLYLSPERLAAPDVHDLLKSTPISFFAVDEAHCVSQWGHEFRPDYRNLARLREWFPEVGIHAYTATATEAVREDVVRALGMNDALTLVGSFDRPNLLYRAEYRKDMLAQVRAVLDRHAGEAGVIYCIRRADVESLCETLQGLGYKALPYHAGLSTETRRHNQEAFSTERVDLIVATVAFGMGIDRSNVRFVIHTGMPKAIENYQQEAGRAGRDRLEAECVLLYGAADPMAWRTIQGEPRSDYDRLALDKINEMYRFCRTLTCRHRFLVGYFGQEFEGDNCGACDVCLGEHAVLPDSLVVAQKILSCVARVKERFGARYVAEVLKGSKTAKVLQNGHDQLTTYGLLAEYQLTDIGDWIDQLTGLDFLVREGEFHTLRLTAGGWALLKGEASVQLTLPRQVERKAPARRSGAEGVALSPQEESLFQELRTWRRAIAQERGVPPYLILGDATLKELAHHRPGSSLALRGIKGIGEAKARDLGDRLLEIIAHQAQALGLSPAVEAPLVSLPRASVPAPEPAAERPGRPNPQREAAFEAFRAGSTVDEVVSRTGRAASTVEGYLLEFVQDENVTRPEPWLSRATYARVVEAAARLQAERLKPIYEDLGERVSYGDIRLALAIRANQAHAGDA